ncbi:ATP-binding protein [Diaphorobacter sp.]|uniref:sensor histidine kinase n=1 Tax=Diaphorobacter sp. TaxID=1934310 RepID=UPI0028A8E9D5|nr:ATP-binding protein [Diaphorobacter sp.]
MPDDAAPASVHAGKNRLHGLRTRLLLILIPVLVALFAYDSWSDSDTLGQELEKAYDQTLLEPAQALADSVDCCVRGEIALTDSFHIRSMFESLSAQTKVLRVLLESADGTERRLLLGPEAFPEPPPAPTHPGVAFRAAGDGARVFYDARIHDHAIRVAAFLRNVYDEEGKPWTALIQTARSTLAIDSAVHELRVQTLHKDLRTLVILVLIIWLGIGWGLRPLQALRDAIRARAPEDLAPLHTNDVPAEVRPLVDAMNQHLDQQRATLDAQRQFLTDASHQLRTPLAIMHTQTGYALRESDPQAVRAALHAILQQLQRSRRVSEQLLSLAHAGQLDCTDVHGAHEVCDVNAIARQVVIEYLPLALEKQIDLGWHDARGDDVQEDGDDAASDRTMVAPVRASALGLREVLANLVHNAIAYTPQRGTVTVRVHMDAHSITALVQDNGPGIAQHDRERAFARFQRLSSAQQTTGSGLGLSIARTYLDAMQGRITLEDGEHGRGLTVRVQLPRCTSAD